VNAFDQKSKKCRFSNIQFINEKFLWSKNTMLITKADLDKDLFQLRYGPSIETSSALKKTLKEGSAEEDVDEFIKQHPELMNLKRVFIPRGEFSASYNKLIELSQIFKVSVWMWDESSDFKPLVEWIRQCKSVHSLRLLLSSKFWPHFAGLTQITELEIHEGEASRSKEKYLELINSLPNLNSLHFKSEEALDCLTSIPFPENIKVLSFEDSKAAYTKVALERFSNLEALVLAKSYSKGIPIPENVLCSLELPWLKGLDLMGNSLLTDKGILSLKRFEHLTSLNLSFCENVEDEALSALLESIQFLFLSLHGCPKITDVGLAKLASQKNLLALSFGGSEGIHDLSFMEFLLKLTTLYIENSLIDEDPKSLPMLVHLKNLLLLVISNAPLVNDIALEALSGMTHLINFQLHGTRVSYRGLAIVKSLTKEDIAWIG